MTRNYLLFLSFEFRISQPENLRRCTARRRRCWRARRKRKLQRGAAAWRRLDKYKYEWTKEIGKTQTQRNITQIQYWAAVCLKECLTNTTISWSRDDFYIKQLSSRWLKTTFIKTLVIRQKSFAPSWSCERLNSSRRRKTSSSIFHFYNQAIYCSICGPSYSLFNRMLYLVLFSALI